ncbi:ABC transporter permease [Stutzerimonas nitrititolerans]|uniref:ABC transporter permease n=1 Tax=Stutzerimonas nitrititolerans TaxID=2482751 RepID=UPI001483A526|nr:ABC transporter permease [Stutzerimonas stutzeri]NNT93258.1 ABC transporter permease [Stutzerimonas nitrititolerans]
MRLGALVRKEFLLLTRDYHALAVLFLMPALFVLLMAFALAEVNQDRLPSLELVLEIPQASEQSAFFTAALRQQLPDGHMPDVSDQPLPRVRLSADFAGQLLDAEQASLGLVFPAATDALTRQRLRAAVQVALAQTRLMTFLLDSGELDPDSTQDERLTLITQRTAVRIDEQQQLASGALAQRANASQHSVPAWLIFGMFFVMLPMANGFQREQQSGVLLRLRCLGVSMGTLALSKLLPYLAINLLQFALLLAIGVWALPLLGLPGLQLPGSVAAYVLLAGCLALAACSLGLAIASLARSGEQALMLSGGINLILAAIGGIMVPRSVMPEAMARLAEISPMSWALDAFLALLVGQGSLSDVAPWCARLLLFAVVVGAAALFLFLKRLNDTQWTTHN